MVLKSQAASALPSRASQGSPGPSGGRFTLGRFVVLDVIGEGGMGIVYKGYDPALRREVALKVVRPQSRHAEPRHELWLVSEARAMAALSHPNIVAIYDATAHGAAIVLAMEYVPGATLSEWLERQRATASWKAIVSVFREAGAGLVAAHHAGLVHRDFKPANVLLGQDGRPRVADFGIATSLRPDPADSAEHGTTVRVTAGCGTPLYMSPEQHRGEAVDARADQYAFCVALWQALYRQPPFIAPPGDHAALYEAKLAEPPTVPKNANVPPWLAPVLTRGLASDPADRWPTMHALLTALDHDVRRRRITAAAVVPALVVVGTLASTQLADRAQLCAGARAQLAGVWDDARDSEVELAIAATGLPYVAATSTHVRDRLDDYARTWAEQYAETCEATAVIGKQPAEVMDLRMACLHRMRGELRSVVDVLAVADAPIVEKAVDLVGALPRLERCGDVRALRADVPPPDDAIAAAVASAREALAAARALDRAAKTETALQRVEAAQATIAHVQYPPLTAELTLVKANVCISRGDLRAGEDLLVQSFEEALSLGMIDLAVDAAHSLVELVGATQRRHGEGLRLAEVSLQLSSGLAGDELRLASSLDALSSMLLWPGRDAEARELAQRAIEILERSLGPDAPQVALARNSLATTLVMGGLYDAAQTEQQRAIVILEGAYGHAHPNVLKVRANYAITLRELGHLEQSIAEHRRIVALLEQSLGPKHPEMGRMRDLLGTVLRQNGDLHEAEAQHRKAVAIWTQNLGEMHPRTANSRSNLALVLRLQGRHAEAVAERSAALTIMERDLGPHHWDVALLRSHLLIDHFAAGDLEGAEREGRRALAVWEAVVGRHHPDFADELRVHAEVLTALGKHDEARAQLERAWSIVSGGSGLPSSRGLIAFALAKSLWPAHRDRALQLARQGKESLERVARREPETLEEVEAWLAERGG